jgi:UDP-N-acetylmuramoyl-tripeptide--D-alanyl-D-alanine ligase
MQIQELYNLFLKYPFITTDSRDTFKNSIFIALKGEKFNGNHFADAALNAGCSYVIVDELIETVSSRVIIVDNCLETLQELANYHRNKLGIPVLAITGSNGKTTTKELITGVLAKKYRIISTEGNLNNHIGVPLTLLRMNSETEIAVIEMGANHIGEIHRLCEIAEPDYGIITNIGKAHLEGFGSPEGVVKAKGELYQFIIHKKGRVFINWDDPILRNILKDKEVQLFKYGKSDECDCMGGIESASPALSFGFYHAGTKVRFSAATQLFGAYNFDNALCAVAVGIFFKVPPLEIIRAIEIYEPKNNRSQILETSSNTIIMDAYNANPSSMRLAINEFMGQDFSNKVIVLGDMFEMGQYSRNEHLAIVELLNSTTGIECYLIGKEFSEVATDKYKSFRDTDNFIVYLKSYPLKGKHILLKGSRGVQLEKCLDYL